MPKRGHTLESDRTCEYCGWAIQAHIPHECDPSICKNCKGKGEVYLGRDKVTREWLGWARCTRCRDGKVIFR